MPSAREAMDRSIRDRVRSPDVPDTSAKPLSSEHEFSHAPVTGLRLINAGRVYLFDDFRINNEPIRLLTIGRHRDNDIVISSKYISRVHCIIERRGKFWTITDPYSSNHTLVHHEQAPFAIQLEGAPLVLNLSMRVLLPGETLYPVTGPGQLAVVALTQHDLRLRAYHLYGSTRQAGKNLGVSHSTICKALKAEKEHKKETRSVETTLKPTGSPRSAGGSKGER